MHRRYTLQSILVILAVAFFFVVCHSQDGTATTLSAEDLSDQLKVELDDPILTQTAGTIDMTTVDSQLLTAWLARISQSTGSVVPDGKGTLLYVSVFNPLTSSSNTTQVQLTSPSLKEGLQVLPTDHEGEVRLHWIEEGTLWTCTYDGGIVEDPHRVLDIGVLEFVPKLGLNTTVYILTEDGTTLLGLNVSRGQVSDPWTIHSSPRDTTISDLHVGRLSDTRTLITAMMYNDTSGNTDLFSLITEEEQVVSEGIIETFTMRPSVVDMVMNQTRAYNIVYDYNSDLVRIYEMVLDGGSVVQTAPLMNYTSPQPHGLRTLIVDDSLHIFYRFNVDYPLERKVQHRVIDLVQEIAHIPTNISSMSLSQWDHDFCVVVYGNDVFVTVSEQYLSGVSTYLSKLVLFEEENESFEPVELLNPRAGIKGSVSGLDSCMTPGHDGLVSTATSTNGSMEVSIFQVEDLSKGTLTWCGATPWFSARSFRNPTFVPHPTLNLIVCESHGTSDVNFDLVLFRFDEASNVMIGPTVVLEGIRSEDWDVTWSGMDGLIVAYARNSRTIEFYRHDLHSGRTYNLGALDLVDRYEQILLGSTDSGTYMMTVERGSENRTCTIREIAIDGENHHIDREWPVLVVMRYIDVRVQLESVGSDLIAISVVMEDLESIGETCSLFLLWTESGTLSGPYAIILPKDQDLFEI